MEKILVVASHVRLFHMFKQELREGYSPEDFHLVGDWLHGLRGLQGNDLVRLGNWDHLGAAERREFTELVHAGQFNIRDARDFTKEWRAKKFNEGLEKEQEIG